MRARWKSPEKGVVVICHEREEARASELETSMKGWGWKARVMTSVRVADEPWRQARAFVVLAGPGERVPWGDAEGRQCLVEMVRRGVSMVSALSGGTKASTLPGFLQAGPQEVVGENVQESRLAAVLAGMLEVTVPELSVWQIENAQAEEPPGSRSFVEERTGMRFLWVPGGRVWMGSGDEDKCACQTLYSQKKQPPTPSTPPTRIGIAGGQETVQSLIKPLTPLGQFRNTFILAVDDEGIAIIDQHVAHERILFEQIAERLTAGRVEVQALLTPVVLELSSGEHQTLLSHTAELEGLGFEVEDFGGTSLRISAVPALLYWKQVDTALRAVASDLDGLSPGASVDIALRQMAATMA